jgi:DNA-binding GntR family transcriptional regulator
MRGLPARPSLRGHVTEYLFDAIVHGSMPPGLRIVEGTLARQLGVSQGTLREALQEIEHQGLVTKIERRGTFVVKLTPEDVRNIYVVRVELEPLAAQLAQSRVTSEDIAGLQNFAKEMRKAGRRSSFVDLVRLDFSFHRLLWKLSGNACIERALNAVCPPLFANFMVRVSSGKLYDFEKDDLQHIAIIEALRNREGEGTREAVATIMRTFETQDVAYVATAEAKDGVKPVQSGRGHRKVALGDQGKATQMPVSIP